MTFMSPEADAASAPTTSKTFNIFTRFQIWLTGTDRELLATCPSRDIGNVKTIAWLMIGVWLWQTAMFALVAHMMLARAGDIRPSLIATAMLIATMILLIDSYMIMRSSWYVHGLEELKRGGLGIQVSLVARIKSWMSLAVRLFISLVLAMLIALFCAVLLFGKDISKDIEAAYQQQNARLMSAVTTRVDSDLRKKADALAAANAVAARLNDEEASLRRIIVDPTVTDAEMKLMLDRIGRLEEAKRNADRTLTAAEAFASNELAGVRGAPGNSGIPGAGPIRRAAEERLQAARRAVETIGQELTAAQTRLRELQELGAASAKRRAEAATQKLADVTRERPTAQARAATLEEEYRAMSTRREQAIQAALEADPSYLPKDDGLLARVRVLKQMMNDPWVFTIVVLFDLAFFALELAAVLSKITTFVPASYSVALAYEDYLRAYQYAQALADEINNLGQRRRRGAQATVDNATASPEPEPEPNTSQATGDSERPAAAAETVGAERPESNEGVYGASCGEEAPRRKRGRPPGSGKRRDPPPWEDIQPNGKSPDA